MQIAHRILLYHETVMQSIVLGHVWGIFDKLTVAVQNDDIEAVLISAKTLALLMLWLRCLECCSASTELFFNSYIDK